MPFQPEPTWPRPRSRRRGSFAISSIRKRPGRSVRQNRTAAVVFASATDHRHHRVEPSARVRVEVLTSPEINHGEISVVPPSPAGRTLVDGLTAPRTRRSLLRKSDTSCPGAVPRPRQWKKR